jgi:hypothetical protein
MAKGSSRPLAACLSHAFPKLSRCFVTTAMPRVKFTGPARVVAPSCGFKKFFSQGEPVTNVWDKSNHFESETVIEEYLLATAEDPNPDVLRLAISNVAKARAKNSKARAKKQVIMLIWLVALAIAIAFSFRCPRRPGEKSSPLSSYLESNTPWHWARRVARLFSC